MESSSFDAQLHRNQFYGVGLEPTMKKRTSFDDQIHAVLNATKSAKNNKALLDAVYTLTEVNLAAKELKKDEPDPDLLSEPLERLFTSN